ncbi:hypothetical protein Tco_0939155 [Tanacetum coccineum]|uniref:Uncharacterized protein n=1 Tax=Tanacetum coccineum TaxID=301880 RepID=A0ABQ5DJ93_9ASTR
MTSAVYEKTSPISDLRWIPTGKLFDSCTSKVDSEPSHGSNVDIPNIHEWKETLDVSACTSINVQKEQSLDLSAEVHQAAETVTTSNKLDLLFDPLFDEYFNGENQVVLKSSAVTTTDASNKRQQQPDSTSSTSTLATTVTANGNFNLYSPTILPEPEGSTMDTILFLYESRLVINGISILVSKLNDRLNLERIVTILILTPYSVGLLEDVSGDSLELPDHRAQVDQESQNQDDSSQGDVDKVYKRSQELKVKRIKAHRSRSQEAMNDHKNPHLHYPQKSRPKQGKKHKRQKSFSSSHLGSKEDVEETRPQHIGGDC